MHNSIVADYLKLLDDQREAIFSEIKGIETSLLWQRPAEKEWSMGENIGWINLIQVLRVGAYHDEHHFRQVRKLYAEMR